MFVPLNSLIVFKFTKHDYYVPLNPIEHRYSILYPMQTPENLSDIFMRHGKKSELCGE